jgi:hypothetical protein
VCDSPLVKALETTARSVPTGCRLGAMPYFAYCFFCGVAGKMRTAKWIPHTVFNFVSDNDIIGGNSGSPAIDAEGTGGRRHLRPQHPGLGGTFGFEDRVNRAVSVSTASITEALRNVYGAQGLVTELTARD